MNSDFRVRYLRYLVAAVVAGLLLLASATLLVALRHLRGQFLASDLYKS